MKRKLLVLLLLTIAVLAGCGTEKMSEPTTLLNQNGEEVTFPQEKPTLFFFITTYT